MGGFTFTINPLPTVRSNEVCYEKKDIFSKFVVFLLDVFY